jgi:hypothetical protein
MPLQVSAIGAHRQRNCLCHFLLLQSAIVPARLSCFIHRSTQQLSCLLANGALGTVVYHQSHLDRRDNFLTSNSKLVALSQVVVHTGMAVGCRCGTHRHKFFRPLVHFDPPDVADFVGPVGDFSCSPNDIDQVGVF